ncbi:MAG: hypothetical protein IPO21_01340 [Bacteroidales bacterium]|nr:hypothetical protein [Bacteroidales bacterium]
MIKFFGFLILFVGIVNVTFSQDLIVTNEGDSINCTITKNKNKDEYVYFTFKYENKELRNSLLNKNQIKTLSENFYSASSPEKLELKTKSLHPNYTIGFNGGYSYRTGKISPSASGFVRDYLKKLKSGYCLGADLYYLTSESFGFGLRYSFYNSRNYYENALVTDEYGKVIYGDIEDNIFIQMICPSVITKLLKGNTKQDLSLGFSLGYQSYINRAKVVEEFKITGNTVGLIIDLAYNRKIFKNLEINITTAMLIGYLSKFKIDNGITKETINLNDNYSEDISRFEFKIGFRLLK